MIYPYGLTEICLHLLFLWSYLSPNISYELMEIVLQFANKTFALKANKFANKKVPLFNNNCPIAVMSLLTQVV